MPKFQQDRTKKETFPTRAEAETWAKEEKGRLTQQGLSVRWVVKSTTNKTRWQATIQIGLEE